VSVHALDDRQRAAWEEAQRLWGVRMHEATAQPRAGRGTFAWFGFPPSITIDPVAAARSGVGDELVSVFAHELGHHVLSPSTRLASLKITQQMARALTASSLDPVAEVADRSHYLGNVWSDMLINVRVAELQRRELRRAGRQAEEPGMLRLWSLLCREPTASRLWWVVLRAYEDLWGLPAGRLCQAAPPAVARVEPVEVEPPAGAYPDVAAAHLEFSRLIDSDPESDAAFLASTVRTFGSDPIRGALRCGMVLAPYLLAEAAEQAAGTAAGRSSGRAAQQPGSRACGGDPDGAPATASELDEVLRDARLGEQPRHPIFEGSGADTVAPAAGGGKAEGEGGGQAYGLADTLALYSTLDAKVVTEAWYSAAAREWIAPYRQPSRAPLAAGELPGALEQWELTDELESIDWPSTLAASPRVIPGVTTRLRSSLDDEAPRTTESVRLDLYIDSSGSMPAPEYTSPAVLAGTILLLSVLRGGGRVRVTSFSGAGDVAGDDAYTRRRSEAMQALLVYFGGGTVFPLDLLAARYDDAALVREGRASGGVERRHLVVLSDDGLQSFFGAGQQANGAVAVDVRDRLQTATLLVLDPGRSMAGAAQSAGYDIDYLDSMDAAPEACARLARRIAGDSSRVGRRRG
jgi:hypothetical protein